MVKFKVALKDLLGKAYYQYTLTSIGCDEK